MLKSFVSTSLVLIATASAGYASTVVSGTFSGTVHGPEATSYDVDAPGNLAWNSSFTNDTRWIDTYGSKDDASSGLRWGGNWVWEDGAGHFSKEDTSKLEVHNGTFEQAIDGESKALLGKIVWHNHSNYLAGDTWDGAIDLHLDFDSSKDVDPITQRIEFSVTNTKDPTTNSSYNETTGYNPDEIGSFSVASSSLSEPVHLGDGLFLKGIHFDLFDAGLAGSEFGFGDAASSLVSGLWSNREGGKSVLGVFGSFEYDMSAVPLPAGAWFLIAGLGGLAMVKRRKDRIS
ncbi:MAG: VPLPA-CTERM sorting domain-containing protein [Pseudomonadota bacterium]